MLIISSIILCSFPVVPQKYNYYDSSDDDIDNESSVVMNNSVNGYNDATGPLLVYPLYSMLSPERQAEVIHLSNNMLQNVCFMCTLCHDCVLLLT